MGYGDTITDPVEVVTNSSYTWEVPAGRTRLYIWNKFIPGYGVYVMDVDTCQAFECAVRVYNKELFVNGKKIKLMKPIEFKGHNVVFAKDQPEYQPLPALKIDSPQAEVISCWKMSFRERIKVLFTGRVWLSLCSFNKPLTPSYMSVNRKDVFLLPGEPESETKQM